MKRYAQWHGVVCIHNNCWFGFPKKKKPKFACESTCENYFMFATVAFSIQHCLRSRVCLLEHSFGFNSLLLYLWFDIVKWTKALALIHARSIVNYLPWILYIEARATMLQIIIEEDAPLPPLQTTCCAFAVHKLTNLQFELGCDNYTICSILDDKGIENMYKKKRTKEAKTDKESIHWTKWC